MNQETYFKEEDTISTYTSKQAVDDGVLLDLSIIPQAKQYKNIFSHITTNLLGKGYFNEDESLNIPNLADLLFQSYIIMKNHSKNFKIFDRMFSGRIELPSGSKTTVYMCINETEKYTIMLPEDY